MGPSKAETEVQQNQPALQQQKEMLEQQVKEASSRCEIDRLSGTGLVKPHVILIDGIR